MRASNNSNNSPMVSVIMNCLNCEKFVKEAIDSVYAQTYPNWEIIFWNNASTDRSDEIAKSYDERLRYVRGKETILLCAARNKALEQARGVFIAFLDCDDVWMPEKLEKQIPLFDDAEVGLVFSDVINFNIRGDEFRIFDRLVFCKGMCFHQLLKSYYLFMPSVVIRKSALEKETEWFDPSFNIIGDYDLFIRIAHSWKLDMCRDALAKYRVHETSGLRTGEDLIYKEDIALLDKFCKLWPDFFAQYGNQMEARIYYRRASYLWRNNRAREARRFLFRCRYKDYKIFALYLASFFPPVVVYLISDKFRKVVRP